VPRQKGRVTAIIEIGAGDGFFFPPSPALHLLDNHSLIHEALGVAARVPLLAGSYVLPRPMHWTLYRKISKFIECKLHERRH
jgi:hypothetical protein